MTSTGPAGNDVLALIARLHRLEAAQAVRTTLARYMRLCDQPCADRAFPQLADLFTVDAVWEGVGKPYEASFGHHLGRDAIAAFVQRYLAPSPHFERNLHFLTTDQVSVADDGVTARGQWLMLQLSTYGQGGSEAITARLNVDFRQADDGRWLIAHFRTGRLECVPWNAAASAEKAA
jgi:ketosteroid isomerase-like protein